MRQTKGRLTSLCLSLLLASVAAQDDGLDWDERGHSEGIEHECLQLQEDDTAAIVDLFDYFEQGYWINDGDILQYAWEEGMTLKKVNYCENDNDTFLALQLIMGDDEGNEVPLHRHGGDATGRECMQWTLKEGDYIREIAYTYNPWIGNVNEVYFLTHEGHERFVGLGFGTTVYYEYSDLKPFAGFASFELDDITLAFSSYVDTCKTNIDADLLPDGFDHLLAGAGITLDEVYGETQASTTHTWDNNSQGTSVHEVEGHLDEVKTIQNADDSTFQGDSIELSDPVSSTTNINIGVEVNLDIHMGDSSEGKAAAVDMTNVDHSHCLALDDEEVVAMVDIQGQWAGEWVDDAEVLRENWYPGMHVHKIRYCETSDEFFASVQVVLGSDDNELRLRKHGVPPEGSSCFAWRLDDDDYIREIHYTFNAWSGKVISLYLESQNGQRRRIGKGEGTTSIFEFSYLKPFVGFLSFEVNGDTLSFGAYDDVCHMSPDVEDLPQGFSDLTDGVAISEDELNGAGTIGSHTWVNDDHGESVHEVESLDQTGDEKVVGEDPEEDHVTTVSVEVDVNVDVYTEEKVVEKIVIEEPQPEPEPVLFIDPVETVESTPEEKVPPEEQIVLEEIIFMPGPVLLDEVEPETIIKDSPISDEKVVEEKGYDEEALPEKPQVKYEEMIQAGYQEAQELELDKLVAIEVEQITTELNQELESVRMQLTQREQELNIRSDQERVEEETIVQTVTKDSDLAWILFFIVAALLLIAICCICCLFFFIRTQKRQRANARAAEERAYGPAGAESSDNERQMPVQPAAKFLRNEDGQLADPYLCDSVSVQQRPDSTVGLVSNQTPQNAMVGATPVVVGMHIAPQEATSEQLAKMNKADSARGGHHDGIVSPDNIQMDFGSNQLGSQRSSAQDTNAGRSNIAPSNSSAAGRNPFESKETMQADEDGSCADLNLSEEDSARGPTAVGANAQIAGMNTPNANQML